MPKEKDENEEHEEEADAGSTEATTSEETDRQETAEADATSEPVEVVIDTGALRTDIQRQVKAQVEAMLQANALVQENADGKGAAEVREELKKREEIAERLRQNPKKEQWMVTIPGTTTHELTGHLRDFCNISLITKGEPGDTVNIPYVTDFDFEILAAVGNEFSDSLGTVYATTTTTLKEAGGWTRIAYKDLEKINANLLDQINQQFIRAALRAEDRIILEDVDGNTTNQLAGAIDRDTESTGTGKISATDIPQAIGKLLVAGKDVQPGECVAYLTPGAYAGLLQDLASSQPFAFATPQYLQTGKVTELMGINIVVGHTWGIGPPRSGATGTCYACFMGRWKRGVVLAPKRELLMEVEKDTRTRTQFLTGSHTIGLKVVHAKEFVRINTSQKQS